MSSVYEPTRCPQCGSLSVDFRYDRRNGGTRPALRAVRTPPSAFPSVVEAPPMRGTASSLPVALSVRVIGSVRGVRLSLPRTPKSTTLRDVGRESGFNYTTVSIVLNDAPLARYVSAETKDAIHKAAKKLGYRPNLFARFLRGQRSNTVGVMVFDMTDRQAAAISVLLGFFRLSILAFEVSERYVQRLVPEPDADGFN